MQNVAVLGATGSIGKSTLDVVSRHPKRFRVTALTAGSNVAKLAQLAAVWRPAVVGIADAALYKSLVQALADVGAKEVRAVAGIEAIAEIAGEAMHDTVVQAIVGAAGLAPTFAAVKAGKRLLLANKESIVCAGAILSRLARESGARILPIDSEHNAIYQCLQGAPRNQSAQAKVWLTCSGGPFHAHPEINLAEVTLEQALAHPTWRMGKKISIDSATLMNKGLEVIEAHHLFDKEPEKISVVIHPQSIVHSMVEFSDGAMLAQVGPTDMRLPIAYCLGWPERIEGGVKPLSLTDCMTLTFCPPDMERFAQLGYAFEAIERGGGAPVVLNAANEVAVNAFLEERCGFLDIAHTCRAMMDSIEAGKPETLEEVCALDAETRERAAEWLAAHSSRA